jgi:flagellar hook-length control protein FliK
MLQASAIAPSSAPPSSGEGQSAHESNGQPLHGGFNEALASMMASAPPPTPPPEPQPKTPAEDTPALPAATDATPPPASGQPSQSAGQPSAGHPGASQPGAAPPSPGAAQGQPTTASSPSQAPGQTGSGDAPAGAKPPTPAQTQASGTPGRPASAQSSGAGGALGGEATIPATAASGQDPSTPDAAQILAATAQVQTPSAASVATSPPAPVQSQTQSGPPAYLASAVQGAPPASQPLDPRLIRFIARVTSSHAAIQGAAPGGEASNAGAAAIDPGADDPAGAATSPSLAPILAALSNLSPRGAITAGPATDQTVGAQTPTATSALGRGSAGTSTTAVQADVSTDATLVVPAGKSFNADLTKAFAALASSASSDGQGVSVASAPAPAGDAQSAASPLGAAPGAPFVGQAPLTLALTPMLVDTAAGAALASTYRAAITAQIAAQVSSKAAAGVSAFDFALEPQGLGRVDVSLKIDPHGQLSAILAFDNPAAAAEAKSRSVDLQQALQQAGFDLSRGDLSFTSTGGHGEGPAWRASSQSWFGFDPGQPEASADPPPPRAARSGGLDIVI